MWLWDNPRSGQIRLFVCLAMLGGAFAAGYHQVFSTLAPYDDEGYVMMSVSQYLQGRPLYDDVFTQYGPAYYTIQAAMHQGLGLTVNHDVTRLTTLAIWLIVSSCGAWCVYRMTTSPLVAMSGFGCVFFHLDKLCLEPGHPQELIALCLVGVVSAGLCLDDRRTIWRCVGWGWLGILLSVALLTKLNIGLFLGLGIFCFVARRMPDELWRRRLLVVGVGAGSILAFGLYRRALMDLSVLALPVVTASSLFVVCRTRFLHVPVADETSQNGGNAGLADSNSVTPGSAATWRAQEVAVLLAAALGTALLILAIQLGRGTSPAGLWRGIVAQHVGFGNHFFHSPDIPPSVMLLSIGLAIGACCWRGGTVRSDGNGVIAGLRWVAVALVGSLLITHAIDTTYPLLHGLQHRGNVRMLMGVAPSLLFLLMGPSRGFEATGRAGRELLATIAGLQGLAAFPTPGTQTAIGSLGLVLACLVIAHDALASHVGEPFREISVGPAASNPVYARVQGHRLRYHPVWGGFVVATLIVLAWRDVWMTRSYQQLTPLNLPGCRLLRTDEPTVIRYRSLVETLRQHADTFVFAEHGHNSVYFWSQLDPPTGLNTTFWPYLLRSEEQSRIVAALRQATWVCVVHKPFDATIPAGELRSYLESEPFERTWANDTFEVAVRRSPPPSAADDL